MNIFFLIPLSIGLGLVGLASFVWALRNGQFNDPEGDARRILPPTQTKKGPADDKLASKPDARHARSRL